MITRDIIPEILSVSSNRRQLKSFPLCEDLFSADESGISDQNTEVKFSFLVDRELKITDRREGKAFKHLASEFVGMEVPLGRIANVSCAVSFSTEDPRLVINPTLSRFGKITLGNIHSVGWLLRDFSNVQLLNKGYALLHGAGLASNSACVLLIGLSNTGKTSTVKRLVSDGNAKTFGDDLFVVDGAEAFACPHTTFNVAANEYPRVQERMLQRARRGIPFYEYIGPIPKMTLKNYFGESRISTPRRIDTVLFLRRSSSSRTTTLDENEAADMLIASNAAEFTYSTNSLFRAYDFLTGTAGVANATKAEERLLAQVCTVAETAVVDGSIDDFIAATRDALKI